MHRKFKNRQERADFIERCKQLDMLLLASVVSKLSDEESLDQRFSENRPKRKPEPDEENERT